MRRTSTQAFLVLVNEKKVALEGVQSDMPRRNELGNTQSLTGELGSGKGWLPPADETALSKPSGDEGIDRAVLSAGPALDDNILGEDFCCFIMQQYTGDRSYRRERRTGARKIVSEVFSPPRITKALSRFPGAQLVPGFALDLTCVDPDDQQPWDFDRREKREKARTLVRTQRPLFLVGSPDCTAFSSWQALNNTMRDSSLVHREYVRARLHLDFCCQLYMEQIDGGRFFLHEHPQIATSWKEPCVRRLCEIEGVGEAVAHLCQYDLEFKGEPIKKPTRFISNAEHVLDQLRKLCHGQGGACSRRRGGVHRPCEGAVAKHAQQYSEQLCRCILRGMHNQLKSIGVVEDGMVGLHVASDEAIQAMTVDGCSGRFKDDLTGQPLKDELVLEARAK